MLFEGEYKFTIKMVADFYDIDERTVKRYLEKYDQELKHNGYILSKGKQLKELKLQFGHVINVPSKTTQLGLFNFRAFLNLGMQLTESENAKLLRSKILDIVIETINDWTDRHIFLRRNKSGNRRNLYLAIQSMFYLKVYRNESR